MALKPTPPADVLHNFIGAVERAHLNAPWAREESASAPRPRVLPFLWRWADIEPLIRQTGELMTPGRGAERRILQLTNPGVAGQSATHTLVTAVGLPAAAGRSPAQPHYPTRHPRI